jgi:long-subunit fatty acid transport protein
MKSFRSFVLAALILVVLPLTSHAAGLWLYEQATPDMGSASAGRVALAADASAASVNPPNSILTLPNSAVAMVATPVVGCLQLHFRMFTRFLLT